MDFQKISLLLVLLICISCASKNTEMKKKEIVEEILETEELVSDYMLPTIYNSSFIISLFISSLFCSW